MVTLTGRLLIRNLLSLSSAMAITSWVLASRMRLDTGLHTGRLSYDDAENLVHSAIKAYCPNAAQ